MYSLAEGPSANKWIFKGDEVDYAVGRARSQKFLIILFFTRNKILHADLSVENRVIDSKHYIKNGLKPMVRKWKKDHPEASLDQMLLYQQYAQVCKTNQTTAYLDSVGINPIDAPPYSPDLSPFDFRLFPRTMCRLFAL
ncbi:hypothetical protein FB645_001591 [Coemansia sp. IMI 203386]|nr:hypothetical protein FB645_001591 [Coemansia sp. IMI 203386]